MRRLAPLVLVVLACRPAPQGATTPECPEMPTTEVAAPEVAAPEPSATRSAARFPEDWRGRWVGHLDQHTKGGSTRVGLALTIEPIADSREWIWRLEYEGQPVRDYRLIPSQDGADRWRIDERNGIVIDAFLVDGALLCRFSVAKVEVQIEYRLGPDGVAIAIATFGREPMRTTPTDDGRFEVASFPLVAYERGTLAREG
jgi:hypothetical protein